MEGGRIKLDTFYVAFMKLAAAVKVAYTSPAGSDTTEGGSGGPNVS